MSLLVSIIMPAYNAENFIKDSIESITNQTYQNWELVIVDDGSTDQTKFIVSPYTLKDDRIKYYWQQNGKQGKARNFGLSKSNGDFIAFIDADDLWLPHKLEVQIREMERLNVDLIYSDSYQFESLPLNKQMTMQAYKGMLEKDDGILKMLEINRIPILTVMVKKSSIEKVNFFSEKAEIQNAEDYHLWLKLLMKGCKLFGLSEILSAYRIHSSASTSGNKLSTAQVIEAFIDLAQLFPEYNDFIKRFLKKRFKDYHYSTSNWDKTLYKSLIIRNCNYLGRSFYIPILLAIYKIGGLKVARKLMTIIVNI